MMNWFSIVSGGHDVVSTRMMSSFDLESVGQSRSTAPPARSEAVQCVAAGRERLAEGHRKMTQMYRIAMGIPKMNVPLAPLTLDQQRARRDVTASTLASGNGTRIICAVSKW